MIQTFSKLVFLAALYQKGYLSVVGSLLKQLHADEMRNRLSPSCERGRAGDFYTNIKTFLYLCTPNNNIVSF